MSFIGWRQVAHRIFANRKRKGAKLKMATLSMEDDLFGDVEHGSYLGRGGSV